MLPEKSADWRLFVAISIPSGVSEELTSIRGAIQQDSASSFRWTHPDDLHLTLFFFGGVEPAKVSGISSAISEVAAAHARITLEVSGLGAFPDPRQPKVLWAGLKESSNLQCLQRAVTEKVTSLGFKRDRDGFTPHITLARIRGGQSLEKFIEISQGRRFGEFTASDLVLYRSRTNPDGPRYQALERFSLRM